MKRNILITGGGGFVGSFLVKRLMETRQYNLFLLFEDLTSPDFTVPNVDVVVHLAAKPNSFEEPAEILAVNYHGTVNLTRRCPRDAQIIFLSSDYVFKSNPTKVYEEVDTTYPETVYGQSKAKAEEFLLSEHPRSTILRASMIYGYHNHRRMNFFRFLEQRLSKGKTVQLFTDVYSRTTHIKDICAVIQKVIDQQIIGIYHVCGSEYVSRYQLGCIGCNVKGYDANLLIGIEKPPQVNIPNYLNLHPSLIFEKEVTTNLEEGISRCESIAL
ncbi:MAG: sugar nucleotide-binding protein [Blastocatellia bacterium]|nr:sugar nucleotide-binding protein [Blastocatellia bacterium]